MAHAAARPLRVAVCGTDDMGHMQPLLHVAKVLAERGHTVRVFSFAYAEQRLAPMAEAAGAEFVPLECCYESLKDRLDLSIRHLEVPFLLDRERMRQPLSQAFSAWWPDVVLADSCCAAAVEFAEQQGLPLVVNHPSSSTSLLDSLGHPKVSNSVSCCGMRVACVPFTVEGLLIFLNVLGLRTFIGLGRRQAFHSLVLVNSFFGLDPPEPMPPNWRLTGPLVPPSAELHSPLQQRHPDLAAWLSAPVAAPTVYVSTGSMVELKEFQVHALFHGLKQVGARAVWSLKEAEQAFLPSADDPDFWIRSWLPQAEVLQHEAVRAFITHCGWGATLECAVAGKPACAMPFFADQRNNAQTLIGVGAAEALCWPPLPLKPGFNHYKPHSISADGVAEVVGRILQDPAYAKAAQRLSQLAKATGGSAEAAQQIEWAAAIGTKHVTSPHMYRTTGTNPFACFAFLAVSGAAAALWPACHAAGAAVFGAACLLGLRS